MKARVQLGQRVLLGSMEYGGTGKLTAVHEVPGAGGSADVGCGVGLGIYANGA